MNPQKYRQWVRFHQLQAIVTRNSPFDKDAVEGLYHPKGGSDLVKATIVAMRGRGFENVVWSKAIKMQKLKKKRHGVEDEEMMKYLLLGRDLFEDEGK